ncbi:MAG: xylan 1,4-beta-xylosidase [Novosphingobium pentaromativorans]|uniref:Xylan 1,4-beta-xylosidase n=1 Tax=Novosphingobium pentaromativorans TaxID=205844 RepID=A0A2W5NSG3_9SPHN|nr:family 43 glycosylhydrolase [Novosphingobium panipatense]PZQ56512.1 MAG: xylan 1,4-beta-xylosidase [Novosphingobium pentaromativorans]
MDVTRRTMFGGALAGTALPALAPSLANALTGAKPATPQWGTGAEGQRKADLGNGLYRNPIISGDHADPTILKDGSVYYMTHSSFDSYPGLVIWRSTDLVNWAPVGPALHRNLGTIWAVDLVKHEGRYFIYIPADPKGEGWSIYVIWADDIAGPWSEPVDLGIRGAIDPGHVVGEDGKRYLFTNGIRRVRLTDDGLATDGTLEQAYNPWRYPDDWVVENFAPEGPKLLRKGEWFYLVTAIGGTAGPVTGHMVIAARSRSINGPWEHCPRNPLVRTVSVDEPWWSRGHATLVEGPGGDWWMVYHGYENGMRTLGRQTLLEPIEWTADGWFRAKGGDLSLPLPKPKGGIPSASTPGLSDDFAKDRFGVQWSFHAPKRGEAERARYETGGLMIAGSGTSPADSSPLTCLVGDRSYEAEVSIDLTGDGEAGILQFYNHKAFVGLGFTPEKLKIYEYSEDLPWAGVPHKARSLRLRVTNHENVVTWYYSYDEGKNWQRHGTRMEVSGIHHNVFGGFLSLRFGIYAAGSGQARLRDFRYRAVNG